MKLTLAEVAHIAGLARLALTEEEISLYREQLSAILQYAQLLQELDTEGIPPTALVSPTDCIMRPDEPQPSMSRDDLLSNAPATANGLFQVPLILDQR